MPACPLSLSDRVEIRVGIELGESDGQIAERVGRHRTTINREINRNGKRCCYQPERAQERSVLCRARPKVPKLVADRALARKVTARLKAKDSPKRISIELAAQGLAVSHETIYQAIQNPDRGLDKSLFKCLHLQRRRRRPRMGYRAPGSNSLGIYCSIHDRPPIALERTEVGHFEGDLIIGARNQSALITVFDRACRVLFLQAVASKKAADVTVGLCRLLARIPTQLRRTLAWDQGAELAEHPKIALACGIDIYIADPKSPWQRPTNEAGNAHVRRYVGKGTDLNQLSTRQLRHIETRINTIPRPTLNWATANNLYHHAVAMTD